MKAIRSVRMAVLLSLAISTGAAQEAYRYTGTVTKDMTIRAERSTSAKKLGSVKKDETIYVIEITDGWTFIEKGDAQGYILTKNVTQLEAAGEYDDAAQAIYTGVAEKNATVRAQKKSDAAALQRLQAGETVYVTELGDQWHRVVKNGVEGYVMAHLVKNMSPARADIALPEGYEPELIFEAVYKAQADVNLSLRRRRDERSELLATVYEDETVDVMTAEGEWAYVRKGDAIGYVKADHLRYYVRYDPFGAYVPGVTWYPYAAAATGEVRIVDKETGEPLTSIEAGAIMAVSAPAEDGSVTLPYHRTTGRIEAGAPMDLEPVVRWEEAENGDLIAVFSTYYDAQMDSEKNIGRLHNIMQGVERLQDTVIPAGEGFSFNDYCAPYTKGNGYALGPIVNYVSSQNMGYGGGICQVSTTLYEAIEQIPIRVDLWRVHSSRGIFYAPLDHDAAVGAGNLDLRLSNVLPYDVRIALQARAGVLTVRIYRAS